MSRGKMEGPTFARPKMALDSLRKRKSKSTSNVSANIDISLKFFVSTGDTLLLAIGILRVSQNFCFEVSPNY